MTSRLPKKSLVLCGCAVYLAGALLWGLREREHLLASAARTACAPAPSAPADTARSLALGTRTGERPRPSTLAVEVPP